jgi:hypothetical protein
LWIPPGREHVPRIGQGPHRGQAVALSCTLPYRGFPIRGADYWRKRLELTEAPPSATRRYGILHRLTIFLQTFDPRLTTESC